MSVPIIPLLFLLEDGQVKLQNKAGKGDAWDAGERSIIQGLSEYDL